MQNNRVLNVRYSVSPEQSAESLEMTACGGNKGIINYMRFMENLTERKIGFTAGEIAHYYTPETAIVAEATL